MSGEPVTFVGDAMAAVVQAVTEVHTLIGQPPVVVGGLAVMCRLSTPYRATTDLDVVDRLLGHTPQLQILRAAAGAREVEPAAVLLPTPYGEVKVDVLEVRQIEIDQPSDDPGDRLHASSHAWANDTATPHRPTRPRPSHTRPPSRPDQHPRSPDGGRHSRPCRPLARAPQD